MMLARRKLIAIAGLTAVLLMLLFISLPAAMAEGDPIVFTISAEPKQLTGPGDVKVSLRVSNTGSTDMVDPVTLYDPAGNVVKSFGSNGSTTLSAGAFKSWEGKWSVTKAQLEAGQFAYTIKYVAESDNGEMVETEKKAVARVEEAKEEVTLSVSRTISPEVVRPGGTVTVKYDLYNSGNTDLVDLRVKENISKNAKTIKTLAAGKRESVEFTAKMGNADLKSSATITYKTKGTTRTLTEKVDEAVIPKANPNLKIALSSPTAGVNIGETATLVITFTNNGNVSYSNVKVVDEKKGEILTNLSIPAGATVVEEKEFRLTEPTTFKVSASLPDNTGETRTLSAGELSIGVFDPEKTLLLTLNLTADKDTVPAIPADVRFHLTVTNNSNVKAEKITIRHGQTEIYTIASLEPGASASITRDVRISQAGKFRFTASVRDALRNTVTFDSNTIQITYAQPTSAPTVVPVVTVAPPELVSAAPADPMLSQARSALLTAGAVIGGLFAVAFVLFLISSVVRIYRKAKSNAAYDHLELGERRDYTEPADEDLEDIEARTEENYSPDEDESTIDRPAARPAEEMPDPDDMPDWDGEGGYRVSRVEPKEEPAPEQESAAPEKTDTAPLPADEPAAAHVISNAPLKDSSEIAEKLKAQDTKASDDSASEKTSSSRRHRRSRRTEDGE